MVAHVNRHVFDYDFDYDFGEMQLISVDYLRIFHVKMILT